MSSEKINLFELDIDIDALTKSASKTLQEIKSLEEGQKTLKKSTADLKKEIKDYSSLMKEAKKSNDTKTYKELESVQIGLKKRYDELSTAQVKNQSTLKTSRKEYNLSLKLVDAYIEQQRESIAIISKTDGSIDQLSVALSKNKNTYKSLSKEQRENTEIGGRLLNVIQDQDAKYKTLHKSIGNTQVEVGNYKDAIKEAFQEGDYFNKGFQDLLSKIPVVGSSLSGMTGNVQSYIKAQKASVTATTGTNKSLKLFKIALISTGIGAIVVALGTLVAGFASTQKGMDAVSKVTKPLGVIMQRLWGVVQELGVSMIDAFKDPKTVIQGLWEAIKTNIVNRITGIADTFKFLGKTIKATLSLNFSEAKENALKLGESVTQTLTGVDNLGEKILNAAKKTGDFFKESIKTGQDLATLEKKIEEAENQLIIKRALLTSEFEKQKEIASDISQEDEKRKAAAQKAIDIQNELLAGEQSILDMKIRLKEAENSMNDTSRADQKELNELIAQRVSFEAQAATKRTEATSQINTINQQIEQKRNAIRQKQIDDDIKDLETRLNLFKAENEGKKMSLSERVNYSKQIFLQETDLLKQKLSNDKINQSEYDLGILLAKQEFTDRQTEINNAKWTELELQELQGYDNQLSMLEVSGKTREQIQKELNENLTNLQLDRLETELTNFQGTEEEKLSLMQQYIGIKNQLLDEDNEEQYNKVLSLNELLTLELTNFLSLSEEQSKAVADVIGQYFNSIMSLWDNVLKVKANQDKQRIDGINADVKNGVLTQARADQDIAQINYKAAVRQQKTQTTQATISYLNGLIQAWSSSMQLGPIAGPIAGVILSGVLTGVYATNLSAIKSQSIPKAEHGAVIDIGGNRHSGGGTKFFGEDGTSFEAERDEKLFILNRAASMSMGPGLSRLNQAHGGKALSSSSSYLADGGMVARSLGRQSNTGSRVIAIDYDLLATKVSEKNGIVFSEAVSNLPNPVTDVKDIISEVNNYNEIVNDASF